MAVLETCREPSLGRHVRRELLRNAWLAFTPILPATARHQRHYLETDSRYMLHSTRLVRQMLMLHDGTNTLFAEVTLTVYNRSGYQAARWTVNDASWTLFN